MERKAKNGELRNLLKSTRHLSAILQLDNRGADDVLRRKTAEFAYDPAGVMVDFMNDLAERSLVDPKVIEGVRLEIGHMVKFVNFELSLSGDVARLAILHAQGEDPGIGADRVPAIQLWVKQIIHFLRAPITDDNNRFFIPVPVHHEIVRGNDAGLLIVPAGDTESLFFGAIVETLRRYRDRIVGCVAPGCERIFVPSRKGRKYCSRRCQNRATGARYRNARRGTKAAEKKPAKKKSPTGKTRSTKRKSGSAKSG